MITEQQITDLKDEIAKSQGYSCFPELIYKTTGCSFFPALIKCIDKLIIEVHERTEVWDFERTFK